MAKKISSVVLCCRNATPGAYDTIQELKGLLAEQRIQTYLAAESDPCLHGGLPVLHHTEMAGKADLVIVVGGDGSMLGASRMLASAGIPVLGINRGHLGFLTDINPHELRYKIIPVLNGEYTLEERFMLAVYVEEHGKQIGSGLALNEIVIHGDQTAHMMNFTIAVNDSVMYSQKADGFIISTPTGSTAYNLSAGGPIIEPSLDVICLVPMFPQSLNCRPLIFRADCNIAMTFNLIRNPENISVSCDGQVHIEARETSKVVIKKSPLILKICHPLSYDYFETLRSKLDFGAKILR